MVFHVGLIRMLDGNVDSPFTAAEGFGGRTRLRTQVLSVGDHGFSPEKIGSGKIAVALSSGSVSESRFSHFVRPVDLKFEVAHIMLHGFFHIAGRPVGIRIKSVNSSGPFVASDTVEHIACGFDQRTVVKVGGCLNINIMFPAEISPACQKF